MKKNDARPLPDSDDLNQLASTAAITVANIKQALAMTMILTVTSCAGSVLLCHVLLVQTGKINWREQQGREITITHHVA